MSIKHHTGGCQCGAVRFRVTALGRASVCHCRMCQKANGAIAGFFVNATGATWTRGTLAHFQSSAEVRRGFCRDCGTPLTFEYKTSMAISIGAFDQPAEIAPTIQMGLESRLPWLDGLANLPLHPEAERAARQERLARVQANQHPDHETDVWPQAGIGTAALSDRSFALRDEQRLALSRYHRAVRDNYGVRLVDVVLIDRRRFIDDVDADLEVSFAVVLTAGNWSVREEASWLAQASYTPLIEAGIIIRSRPVSATVWKSPDIDSVSHDVRRLRAEATATAQRTKHAPLSDLAAYVGQDANTP